MTHLYYPCYSSTHNLCKQGETFDTIVCYVLDIQGKSAQKLLVENNLSNLTLASADDRLCYWTSGLLDFL